MGGLWEVSDGGTSLSMYGVGGGVLQDRRGGVDSVCGASGKDCTLSLSFPSAGHVLYEGSHPKGPFTGPRATEAVVAFETRTGRPVLHL